MIPSDESASALSCNGVLIHPRLVLTAAHCVCARWQPSGLESPERIRIDTSSCSTQVQLTAIRSSQVEGSSWPSVRTYNHSGQVRLHPEFKIILDAQGNAEASHADLAVILLEKPVDPSIPPAQLTKTEAQLDELLVIAGYGYETGVRRIHGTRFFKRSKVRKLPAPPDDKFVSEPQGIHFTSGYRGGPCFREQAETRGSSGSWGLAMTRSSRAQALLFTSPGSTRRSNRQRGGREMRDSVTHRCASMLLALLAASGCAGTTPAGESPPGPHLEPRPSPTSMRFMILNAEGEDVDNRYLSTLVVGKRPEVCSGVLVHPHLVLTAAHCVCLPIQGQKRLDRTACAKSTEVTSLLYVRENAGWELVLQTLQGVVRPHENFAALLDDDMSVLGATSDLAVVLLEKPMENVPLGFQLTSSAVEIDDELVVAGYGNTKVEQKEPEVRRFFGRNTITQKSRSNLTNMKDKDIVFAFERRGRMSSQETAAAPASARTDRGAGWWGLSARGMEDSLVSRASTPICSGSRIRSPEPSSSRSSTRRQSHYRCS